MGGEQRADGGSTGVRERAPGAGDAAEDGAGVDPGHDQPVVVADAGAERVAHDDAVHAGARSDDHATRPSAEADAGVERVAQDELDEELADIPWLRVSDRPTMVRDVGIAAVLIGLVVMAVAVTGAVRPNGSTMVVPVVTTRAPNRSAPSTAKPRPAGGATSTRRGASTPATTAPSTPSTTAPGGGRRTAPTRTTPTTTTTRPR